MKQEIITYPKRRMSYVFRINMDDQTTSEDEIGYLNRKLCQHEKIPQSYSENRPTYHICPDCSKEIEICTSCGGMIDYELYKQEGFVDGLCQNLDYWEDGCKSIPDNYHVNEDTAQWEECD